MVGVIIAYRKSNKTRWRIGLTLMDTIEEKTPYMCIYTSRFINLRRKIKHAWRKSRVKLARFLAHRFTYNLELS